ncbi:hypothetical protein AAZV13_15G105500 [Glycine max]
MVSSSFCLCSFHRNSITLVNCFCNSRSRQSLNFIWNILFVYLNFQFTILPLHNFFSSIILSQCLTLVCVLIIIPIENVGLFIRFRCCVGGATFTKGRVGA